MTSQDTSPLVLLVTHSADHFTVDRVAAGLQRRGARPLRFDTDAFPTRHQLTLAFDTDGVRACLRAEHGALTDLSRVQAVWMRKQCPAALPDDLAPELAPGCRAEARATLTGLWTLLTQARFLDPPDNAQAAEDKLRQLRLALASGLRVPRTLVTNDPAAVRRLFDETGGNVVAKMLQPLSQSMGSAPLFVYTNAVQAADLEQLDGLAYAPMIFQERVAKQLELRVAYVGGRCFAGAIDASASVHGAVDWRRAEPHECRWVEAALPEPVQAGLRRLMHALGLRFGAVDLIRTPAGEHVFLEVNPGGEWGMLERDLGLPIADAIAEELLCRNTS